MIDLQTVTPLKLMSEQTKRCTECGAVKPIMFFTRDIWAQEPDGLQTACRLCVAQVRWQWRPNRACTTEKAFARRLVNVAVRLGDLIRPDHCERCASQTKRALDGHHEDYSRPLDVVWLCRACHKARHREIEAERVAA
jgi:hypothetical protein